MALQGGFPKMNHCSYQNSAERRKEAPGVVSAVVATKIDKLTRGQRIRAMRELESVFGHPVLPVSAIAQATPLTPRSAWKYTSCCRSGAIPSTT